MKTTMVKAADVKPRWYVANADGRVLGRLAARVAQILQGKNKPTFTPHELTGDFVVIVNAEKIRFTGGKARTRVIRWHTEYIGSLKEVVLDKYMAKHPEKVVKLAVRRMLPKTKLGRKMLARLKVYTGPEHRHAAQAPIPLEF